MERLNEWISEMVVEGSLPEIMLFADLEKFLRKKNNRHFIIKSLINIKKNLTGMGADTTIYLYEALHLREDSLKSLKSSLWYHKARGIYELYMMNQQGDTDAIFTYTNDDNEYVRMEAQTAIIGFAGFEGLVFLDTLSYPLHEWQQIKLLEQLAAMDTVAMPHLPLWLQSSNQYVVQFALKLADIYQQFSVHDTVALCLDSPNEKIRHQAIKTLGRLAQEQTAAILCSRYSGETPDNQLEIVKQLIMTGSSDELPFLLERLKEEDDNLVLEAGRAIVTIDRKGWALLEQGLIEGQKLPSIFKQIKYELAG